MRTRKFDDLTKELVADPRRAREIAAMQAAMEDALALAEIRERRGLRQTDVAEVLGASQARVSQLENQRDLYLSTLKFYVEALGGELEIAAVFGDERIPISVDRAK